MLLNLLAPDGLENGLVLQIHYPAWVQAVKDLSGVLGSRHRLGIVLLRQLVAVLLGQDEPLLCDESRIGQVAPVLRVGVVSNRIRCVKKI